MTVKRATRVGGRLQEELATLVRNLGDPRAQGALVSRVEVTDDLQQAKVYVRHERGADSPETRKALLAGLSAAGGFLRKETARALGLRYAPNLRFFYDEAPDARKRIEELLDEVHRDGDPKD